MRRGTRSAIAAASHGTTARALRYLTRATSSAAHAPVGEGGRPRVDPGGRRGGVRGREAGPAPGAEGRAPAAATRAGEREQGIEHDADATTGVRHPSASGIPARCRYVWTRRRGPRPTNRRKDDPHMHVFMSWARSTVTQLERSLGRSEHYFDRILIGVLVLLAVAVLFLFTAS